MILFFILSVYLPIDSWQNELVEEMQVRGVHFTRFPSVRPYDIAELEFADGHFLSDRLWLPNFSGKAYYDTITVLRLKPSLYHDWSGFSICVQPVIKFGDDSLPPDKVFADLFSADYERAYVKYQSKHAGVFIGRERFAIGPSPRYNLLLSGYSAPMDWLHFSLQSRKFKFSYYLSRLDNMYTKRLEYVGDTIVEYIDATRYLSIRRLDFSPTEWLNVSFTEGATFGGKDHILGISDFNPVILLHAYQYNRGNDANIFFHLDAKIFLKNFCFYGALLVDDYQLESDPNNEPNHLGINVGFECADLFNVSNIFWMIEYTAVSRYTYCHFVPYQRYQYLDTPIGSPFGPGYDEVYTKFSYHLNPKIDLYSQMSYFRKGEAAIEALWPIPEYPRVPGTLFPEENFLFGTIQESIEIGFGLRFFHHHSIVSDFYIGYLQCKNYQNRINETKKIPVFRLTIDILNLFNL